MSRAPEVTLGHTGNVRPESFRGMPGCFGLARDRGGQWSLVDPSGRPCWLRAVHGVGAPAGERENLAQPHPTARLRAWGFNAVGLGGDGAGQDYGWPFLANGNFLAAGPVIRAPGVRLPDVFASDWLVRAMAHATLTCAPLAGNSALVAWVTDDELAWGPPASANAPGLLQVCLSLEPSWAAYHAAWEFILAAHSGRLASLERAWGIPLPNREIVREMTRTERGIRTRGYARDDARWAREFARRYFMTTADAIRGADGHHLVAGCRFRSPVGTPVLGGATYPVVDFSLPHWAELAPPMSAGAPVLAGEVSWSDEDFSSGGGPIRLTSVERMLRRGRQALARLARHPAVVGYIWRQWHDEPGEQPPFASGLVHANGAEAREHTELLAAFNVRVETKRRSTAQLFSP